MGSKSAFSIFKIWLFNPLQTFKFLFLPLLRYIRSINAKCTPFNQYFMALKQEIIIDFFFDLYNVCVWKFVSDRCIFVKEFLKFLYFLYKSFGKSILCVPVQL